MKTFIFGLMAGSLLGVLAGFSLGLYALPILIEEEGISDEMVEMAISKSERSGTFRRDLKDSDFLHWGQGRITLFTEGGSRFFVLQGEVSPGPNYKLYMTPAYVETEKDFLAIKADSAQVTDIKTFRNFRVRVPDHIDTDKYPAVLIWCERFRQFITSASLQ